MLDYDSVLDSFINRNIKKEVLNIDDYEITYYRQKDCKDFVIFDNDDSLIHFQSREDLIQYIIEKVVNGKENYPDILFKGSNLLKDYTYGIAYHISSVSNREDILAKGLIPNGKSDLDTLPTSIYLDRYRIKSIPKNFYKSLSVYLYPEYYLSSTERTCANNIDLYHFDSNIQQIKCRNFDYLFYGLFFMDCVEIYGVCSSKVYGIPGYSDHQHAGNEGEGQFHLNNSSIEYHRKKHYLKSLTYPELFELLRY